MNPNTHSALLVYMLALWGGYQCNRVTFNTMMACMHHRYEPLCGVKSDFQHQGAAGSDHDRSSARMLKPGVCNNRLQMPRARYTTTSSPRTVNDMRQVPAARAVLLQGDSRAPQIASPAEPKDLEHHLGWKVWDRAPLRCSTHAQRDVQEDSLLNRRGERVGPHAVREEETR
jgi:hypothetical protein